MTVITKPIGRLPINKGDWNANYVNPKTGIAGYGKKFRTIRYGCELESKIENNTYDPITWDGADDFTIDTTHWLLVSGNPQNWLAGQDKPSASEQYPYNGMGRIVLKKNMVNGVNTLTQSMMQATNTIYVIQYDYTLGEDITVPANCVLEFDGGSFNNGKIQSVGNTTFSVINPDNHCIFNEVDVMKNVIKNVPKQGLDIRWFGASVDNEDNSDAIQRCQFCAGIQGIFIAGGIFKVSKPIIFVDGMVVHGVVGNRRFSVLQANSDFKTNYPDRGILEDRAFTHIEGVTRYDAFGGIVDIPNYTSGNFWTYVEVDSIQIYCRGNAAFGIVNVCGDECSCISNVLVGGAIKADFLHVGASMKITYENCSATNIPYSNLNQGVPTEEKIWCNGYEIQRPYDWGYGFCITKHPTNPDFTWDQNDGVFFFSGCTGNIAVLGHKRSVTVAGHKCEDCSPIILLEETQGGQMANKLNIIGIGGVHQHTYPSIYGIVKSSSFKGVYDSGQSYNNGDIVLLDYIPKKYNSSNNSFETFRYVLSNSIVYEKNDIYSHTGQITIEGCGFTLVDGEIMRGIFESENPYYYDAAERKYIGSHGSIIHAFTNNRDCEIGQRQKVVEKFSICSPIINEAVFDAEIQTNVANFMFALKKIFLTKILPNGATDMQFFVTEGNNNTLVLRINKNYVDGVGNKPSIQVGNSDGLVGFFGSGGWTKQTMTGTVSAEMKSLLSVLDNYGLIKDETTT